MSAVDPQAALFAAFAKAQGEFPLIAKDREVEVTGKTKAGAPMKYKFSYAQLAGILAGVRPVLAANGLAVTQMLTSHADGRPAVQTMLLHADGGSLAGLLPIKTDGLNPQDLGSLITYIRRYAILCLLGLAPDDDDDANAATGNIVRRSTTNGAAPRVTKAPASLVSEIEETIAELNASGVLGEVEIRDGMKTAFGTSETAALTLAQASDLKKRLTAKVGVPA